MNKSDFFTKLFCIFPVIIALSGCSTNGQTSSDVQTISSETNLQEIAIPTQIMSNETTQTQAQTTPMQIVTTTVQTETTIVSQKSTNTAAQTQQTQQDTSSLTSLTTTSEVTTTQTTTESTTVTATQTQQTQQDTSSLTSLTTTSEVTTTQTTTESTTVLTSDVVVQIEYPALTPLTIDENEKLKEDFAKYKSSVWTNPTSDEMAVMNYYGKYNGNEVVVMYGIEYEMTDDMKEVNVGKYTFELPSGSLEILLHTDNDFIDIQTAYATGYLSDEDIAAIYYYSTNK